MKYLIPLVLIAGCATSPERIAPVANFAPCTEANRERLAELTELQTTTASLDGLGVFTFGIPIGSFTRKDHEAEIAILKGRCT